MFSIGIIQKEIIKVSSKVKFTSLRRGYAESAVEQTWPPVFPQLVLLSSLLLRKIFIATLHFRSYCFSSWTHAKKNKKVGEGSRASANLRVPDPRARPWVSTQTGFSLFEQFNNSCLLGWSRFSKTLATTTWSTRTFHNIPLELSLEARKKAWRLRRKMSLVNRI